MAVAELARQRPQGEEQAERWPVRLVALSTAVCAALVLFGLGEKSLWYDEAFSVGIVDRPVGDVLWRLANWEVNQSPYYLVLTGWWRLGQGEAFLRLLSAVPAIAAIPALYVLGRRLLDARVGAVAALLLAVHALVVQWGQQLRAYSLVTLLVILATTLLLRALGRADETRPAVLYGVVAAIATYAHFYAGLVVVAHAVWVLLRRPVPWRLLVASGATYGCLVAPLAWYLVTREGDPLSWVGRQGGSVVARTAKGLAGAGLSPGGPSLGGWANVVVYGVAIAAGAWAVTSARRAAARDERWWCALLPLWLLLPVAVVSLSTATVKPLLEPRFLIVVVPAMALLAATGICRLGARAGGALLAALLVLSLVGVLDWHRAPSYEDWRGATEIVVAGSSTEAVVVVEPWGGLFPLRYYQERLGSPPRAVLRPEADEPPAGAELVEVRREAPGGEGPPFDAGYLTWRDRHYALRDEARVQNVVVRFYERR